MPLTAEQRKSIFEAGGSVLDEQGRIFASEEEFKKAGETNEIPSFNSTVLNPDLTDLSSGGEETVTGEKENPPQQETEAQRKLREKAEKNAGS